MHTFNLEIRIEGSALEKSVRSFEVARILEQAATRVRYGTEEFKLTDANGNAVGEAYFTEEWGPVRDITLPPQFYEERATAGGGTVRDLVPMEDATAYVTDGERYGIRYMGGAIDWLGTDIEYAFGDGARVLEEES